MAAVVVLGVRTGIALAYEVDGPSMEPTLRSGERLLVARCAYGLSIPYVREALAIWALPDRGSIVILQSPVEPVDLVKRVIGLPGDVVEIRDDVVWLDGEPLVRREIGPCEADRQLHRDPSCRIFEERLGDKVWRTSRRRDPEDPEPTESHPPIIVPPGHLYVLGDHRDESNDSRYFGPVPVSHLRGRVLFVD